MDNIYIDRINSQGDGIGRAPDGRTVFVEGALPGETVSIAVRKEKKSYISSRVNRVIVPSEHRREPLCRWYRSCGGCQLQHADYEMQCRIKSMLVSDAMRRIGGFGLEGEIECVPSSSEWGYRNKASFPVRAKGQKGQVGFFKSGSHEIVPIDKCPVIGSRANKLYSKLKGMIEGGQFCCYNERSSEGWLRHVVIRSARDCEELLLLLVAAAKPEGGAFESLCDLYDYLKEDFPELRGLAINVNTEEGNVILGPDTVLVKGEDCLTERLELFHLNYDSTSFFQANPHQAESLFSYASSLIGEGRNIVELYCGVGAFSVFLAQKARSVKAIELWPSAVIKAAENARMNHMENFEVSEDDAVAAIKKGLLEGADCVVMDPPRTGCERAVLDAIMEAEISTVLYVSCDPATLARDARILCENGYALKTEALKAFDMFPQTSHVETVALIVKAAL